MNCGICSHYLAFKRDAKSQGIRIPYCAGCRPRNKNCAWLKKRCELLGNNKIKYCYECIDFPCRNLTHIDERYRRYYHMSMIMNLEFLRKNGVKRFLEGEERKWKCPNCGGVISCHNGICFDCGLDMLKIKKNLYRWES